jgi:hypothetical protein
MPRRRQPSQADRQAGRQADDPTRSNIVSRHQRITASSPSPFPPITQSPVPKIKAGNISRKERKKCPSHLPPKQDPASHQRERRVDTGSRGEKQRRESFSIYQRSVPRPNRHECGLGQMLNICDAGVVQGARERGQGNESSGPGKWMTRGKKGLRRLHS